MRTTRWMDFKKCWIYSTPMVSNASCRRLAQAMTCWWWCMAEWDEDWSTSSNLTRTSPSTTKHFWHFFLRSSKAMVSTCCVGVKNTVPTITWAKSSVNRLMTVQAAKIYLSEDQEFGEINSTTLNYSDSSDKSIKCIIGKNWEKLSSVQWGHPSNNRITSSDTLESLISISLIVIASKLALLLDDTAVQRWRRDWRWWSRMVRAVCSTFPSNPTEWLVESGSVVDGGWSRWSRSSTEKCGGDEAGEKLIPAEIKQIHRFLTLVEVIWVTNRLLDTCRFN